MSIYDKYGKINISKLSSAIHFPQSETKAFLADQLEKGILKMSGNRFAVRKDKRDDFDKAVNFAANERERLKRDMLAAGEKIGMRKAKEGADSKVERKTWSSDVKNFIEQAFRNKDYKVDRETLRQEYAKPKYHSIIKDIDTNDIVDAVYDYSTGKIIQNKKRIKMLAQIGMADANGLGNLSPELQQEINNAIIEEQKQNNIKSRLKWKLPVDKPKWQKAMIIYKVNPMLSRGAYGSANY